MSHDTIDQIKKSIRKLDEQIEEVQEKRLARGLPASPPSRFVPLPLAWTIYKQLDPLIKYAVQYASLVDNTDEIIDIEGKQMEWIKSHELDVLFISNSDISLGLIKLGIGGIYKALTGYDGYETAGELLRELVRYIQFTRPRYGDKYNVEDFIYRHDLSNQENEKAYHEVRTELKRLEDGKYFQEEYDKLIEYYETIKEDF